LTSQSKPNGRLTGTTRGRPILPDDKRKP
jgi:hypothetical protein